ncbi:MAG: hypothetical protein ACKO1F_01285, partial [Flammeovirgaceae bacterium]
NSLGEQLTYNRIQTLLDESKKWRWFSYILIPIIYFLKFSLVTICLLTGLFFWNIDIRISRIFLLVMLSEFIFFIPVFLKVIWFSFFVEHYNLQDIQMFSPFTLLSLFDTHEVEPWLTYPMRLINLFELAYILLLSKLLSREINYKIEKGIFIVLSSYGTGVLIWTILITFMTLNLF